MVKKNSYDWKKTLVKGGKSLVIILVAGGLSVYGGNPAFLAFVPLMEMLLNWLKHRSE